MFCDFASVVLQARKTKKLAALARFLQPVVPEIYKAEGSSVSLCIIPLPPGGRVYRHKATARTVLRLQYLVEVRRPEY
ncbi:unnamed protein product [Sphagnum troendelagicum]|uniref:Uncharacterized protein n=1 Tax=Sphagnum jensenii TaxID=128206 RepID=A0ABP0WZ10_9BRYO